MVSWVRCSIVISMSVLWSVVDTESAVADQRIDSTPPVIDCLADITIQVGDSTDPMHVGTLEPMLYFAVIDGHLGRMTLDGSVSHFIIDDDETNFEDVAVDVAGGKIYWADGDNRYIMRCDLDGDNEERVVRAPGSLSPDNLELDLDAGKIYWVDGIRIRRSNLDGSNIEQLNGTFLNRAESIDLDRANGRVYFTESTGPAGGTYFFDLGNWPPTLLSGSPNTFIMGLALDLKNGRFFVNENSRVKRGNLDGTGIINIHQGNFTATGCAYDPGTDTVYFAWNDGSLGPLDIYRMNADGSNKTNLFRPTDRTWQTMLEIVRPVTDDTDPNPAITYSDVTGPGPCTGSSVIERTWTATDASGNSATCVQYITILPDDDNDEVCNEFDVCPEGDDNADYDMDGVADACDPCMYDADIVPGACIMPDGSCVELCLDDCYEGTFMGSGVPCNDCNGNNEEDLGETADEYAPAGAVLADNCAAAPFVEPGTPIAIDTTADTTVNVQFCNSQFSAYNVWAKYRPSWDGLAYVSASQSPMATMIIVFDDCPDNGGAPIACNWPNPGGATFTAQRGETYWIMFGGYGVTQGTSEANIIGPRGLRNPVDYNRNGIPDECDCLFDVDNDGNVGMLDFIAAVAAIGPCAAGPCPADVDGDGIVDDADLALILNNQGSCLVTPLPVQSQRPTAESRPVRLKGTSTR